MELHIPELLFSFNTGAGIVTVASAMGLIWIGGARYHSARPVPMEVTACPGWCLLG